MWKARKKRRLLAGEQEFLCHHPSWALVFQEKWDRSVSSAGAENWNNFTGSKRGQSCIRINPDHCGCYTDRATFHFLARAKLKEPLQVALVTSILSLERHTSLPPSSVTLHPQDSAILWPRACDWELGLLIRDKTMGKSNKQANKHNHLFRGQSLSNTQGKGSHRNHDRFYVHCCSAVPVYRWCWAGSNIDLCWMFWSYPITLRKESLHLHLTQQSKGPPHAVLQITVQLKWFILSEPQDFIAEESKEKTELFSQRH